MYKNIPIKTTENGHEEQYDHEQLISIIHRLVDERDHLWRENEYLKSKLNESMLIETINDMKRERELLFKLLLNLSNQQKDELPPPPLTHHSNHHSEEQYVFIVFPSSISFLFHLVSMVILMIYFLHLRIKRIIRLRMVNLHK